VKHESAGNDIESDEPWFTRDANKSLYVDQIFSHASPIIQSTYDSNTVYHSLLDRDHHKNMRDSLQEPLS